jgi:hypothetical protein
MNSKYIDMRENKEYEDLKQKPEFKILFNEFKKQSAIIEEYISKLEESSEFSLKIKKGK